MSGNKFWSVFEEDKVLLCSDALIAKTRES